MFVMYVCLRDKSCLLSSFFHSDSVWIEVWIIVTFFFLSFSFSGYGGPWITMISVFLSFSFSGYGGPWITMISVFFLSFSFSGYGGPWITMISVFFQFHSIFYLLVYNWFDYYNDLVFKRDNFIMILINFFF
jgi:hypothetical protein